MIRADHRQKLTNSKYAQRLIRYPWRIRCLPLEPEKLNTWLPVPQEALHEVEALCEAATTQKALELADYAVCRPRLVSLEERDDTFTYLVPRKEGDPPLIWLRWISLTCRPHLFVNPDNQTYLQTTSPKFSTSELPRVIPVDYRKPPQYFRWVEWARDRHADILDSLARTRLY